MCNAPQLVDDQALAAMMRSGCSVAQKKCAGGGEQQAQAADGVRKFQMGSVPDRGGRTFLQAILFHMLPLASFDNQTHTCLCLQELMT